MAFSGLWESLGEHGTISHGQGMFNPNLPVGWWGGCAKTDLPKKEERKVEKKKCAHSAPAGNRTQNHLLASLESVTAHHGHCFDKLAFPWVKVGSGDRSIVCGDEILLNFALLR